MSLPVRWPGFPAKQTTKEGWVYEKHGKPDGD